MKFTVVFVSLLAICLECCAEDKLVFGTDDRLDVYELPESDPYRILAEQSVVAMISRALLEQPDGEGRFDTLLSKDNYPDTLRLQALGDLCDDQKFLKDPTLALCTGTLIAPDQVLTAAYCIDELTCPLMSFVFGYYATGRDEEGYPTFPVISDDNVYHCDSVLKSWSVSIDFAIVTLDRPVNDTRYVPVNLTTSSDALEIGTELTLIGFPSGIPAKIARNGVVTDPRNDTKDYFYVEVDGFAGNSGSGLFTDDLVQVGVLVRGTFDYVDNGTCNVVNILPPCNDSIIACGEQATYAFHASVPIDFGEVYEGTIQCGENVTGTTEGASSVIGYESGERVYDFFLNATQLIDIAACQSDYDTVLRVYDGDGLVELAVCDDCGDCGTCPGCNLRSRLSSVVPAGHYYVVIEGYRALEGNYVLSLQCTDAPDGTPEPEVEDTPAPRARVPTPVV